MCQNLKPAGPGFTRNPGSMGELRAQKTASMGQKTASMGQQQLLRLLTAQRGEPCSIEGLVRGCAREAAAVLCRGG